MSDFCDPINCSLPGSSVHWILQARILEWVAMSSSRGSSTQGSNLDLLHCRQILYHLSHLGHPAGSIYFNHFPFCSSDCIISVVLFLIAMILSSASSSLPLNPSSDFFHFESFYFFNKLYIFIFSIR